MYFHPFGMNVINKFNTYNLYLSCLVLPSSNLVDNDEIVVYYMTIYREFKITIQRKITNRISMKITTVYCSI